MDDAETVVAIRNLEQQTGQKTPLIALTAHAMEHDKELLLNSDFDGLSQNHSRCQR